MGGQGYAPGGPPKKKGGAFIAIAAIGGVVVIAGIVLVVFFVFGGGSFHDSEAHKHLPDDCEAVVRVDIKGILAVDAVKEHVIPALDEKMKESEDASKMAAFLLTAKLDPRKDFEEAVVCLKKLDAGGKPEVVAIVGGHLLENGIVNAIEKHGKKGEFKAPKEEDGLKIIEAEDEPVFVSHASDAALLIGNDKGMLKDAAKTGDAFDEKYKIPMDEQIVAIVTADTVKKLSGLAAAATPFGAKLKGAGRIVVSATLDPGKIGARLEMPSKNAATELRDELQTFLDQMKNVPGGGGLGDPLATAALNSAKIKTKGKDLIIEIPIDKKMIEKFLKEVAKGIRKADEEI
jgi:hypothetical protein